MKRNGNEPILDDKYGRGGVKHFCKLSSVIFSSGHYCALECAVF